MALQEINLGTYANDGTGDDLRTAFEKVKANFTDIYNSLNGANVGATPPTVDVDQGELWWNTLDGRLYIKYNTAWVDASPTVPSVHYNVSAETTAGGARLQLTGTDLSLDSVTFASGTNITVSRTNSNVITFNSTSYTGNTTGTHNGPVYGNVQGNITGNVTGNLTGNVTGNLTGNISGNAGTVSNGVYTTGSYADPNWITSIAGSKVSGNISGNAGTVTNGVYTTGSYSDPNWITSIAGSKVSGNISGNAGTVTNGVYTTSSINALADVDTVSVIPLNGQALVWNSGAGQWKPGTVAGGGGGVTKIVAGANITISPTNGLGEVTISSSGGGFDGNADFGTFDTPGGTNYDFGTF